MKASADSSTAVAAATSARNDKPERKTPLRERPEDGGIVWHEEYNAFECLGCSQWEEQGSGVRGQGSEIRGPAGRLMRWLRGWWTLPERLRMQRHIAEQNDRYRARFRAMASDLGCDGLHDYDAAIRIANRCMGAELALQRLADAAEREAEADGLPGLSAAEVERLALLAEECGEVARAVGKVLRHGWQSCSPYGGRVNRVAVEREIGNVRAIVNLMLNAKDVRLDEIQKWQRSKRCALPKWTHHQPDSMPREEQLAMMQAIADERMGLER